MSRTEREKPKCRCDYCVRAYNSDPRDPSRTRKPRTEKFSEWAERNPEIAAAILLPGDEDDE